MYRFLLRLAVSMGALCALPAPAQEYPTQSIRLIVAAAAGGASDIMARQLGQKLEQRLGQTVVVEPKPGANGNIAAEFVAQANPDGYTLMMGNPGSLGINTLLYKRVRYNPLKDFAPVARLVSFQSLLVVRPDLPARNVKELVDYAKAHPGALRYGSAGTGGSPHMAMVQFAQSTGTNLLHVPYKGAAPALQDLMGGQIDLAFSDALLTQPHLSSGRVRALATSGNTRLASIPDLPTVAEAGVPGYSVTGWLGVVAPTGTPPAIVARLNKVINEIMATPEMAAKIKEQGAETITTTPEEFGRFMAAETARWKKVIADGNVVAD